MASTRNGRDKQKPDVRDAHMVLTTERVDIENSVTVTTAEENENTAVNKGDFFSMFYLPSNQSYGEDVHFASSSYNVPFQGAASAVMGGILSVLDTALAVLNEDEEFDKSDSIISDSTKDEVEDDLQGNCVSSEISVMRCCKHGARSQLTTPCTSYVAMSSAKTHDKKTPDNKTSAVLEHMPKQEIDVRLDADTYEQNGARENDGFTPHIPLIGSISTLQLYEEDTGNTMKKLISDLQSESINDMQIETHFDTDSKSESSKKEDSEYCIIRSESETNDGWLVVCGD